MIVTMDILLLILKTDLYVGYEHHLHFLWNPGRICAFRILYTYVCHYTKRNLDTESPFDLCFSPLSNLSTTHSSPSNEECILQRKEQSWITAGKGILLLVTLGVRHSCILKSHLGGLRHSSVGSGNCHQVLRPEFNTQVLHSKSCSLTSIPTRWHDPLPKHTHRINKCNFFKKVKKAVSFFLVC